MEEERAVASGGGEVVICEPSDEPVAPQDVGGAAESGTDDERSEESREVNEEVDGGGGDEEDDGDISESDSDDDDDDDGGGWFHPSEDDTVDDDYDDATFTDSFLEAAEHLEEAHGGPIERLCVIPPGENGGGGNQQATRVGNEDAAGFRRFVAALGRPQRRGGRAVRAIHFDQVDWDRFREEDLARFFGEVLPSHPTLEVIGLGGYEIPQPFVRTLVSSIREGGTTPLQRLELQCAIDHDSVQAVADMIRRNVALPELWVDPLTGPRLAPGDCKLICQSVLHNTHLRVLRLRPRAVAADALDDVVAASSLRRLEVIADEWSDECVAGVARQLRTNTTLESLQIINSRNDDGHSPLFRPIAEVLETYNFTLRKVTIRLGVPIPRQAEHELEDRVLTELRRRNRLFRRAVERHLEPRGYHVSPASLWPRALGTVSAVPTLVYRLLRNGDLNALGDLLQPGRAARGKKRGTPPALRA